MVIYPDGGYCFGCNKSMKVDTGVKPKVKMTQKVGDINQTLGYINSLPKKEIRGLELPYDNLGYYIVYSGNNFYLRRNWKDGIKYVYPANVEIPIFIALDATFTKNLIIVEGQINALSLVSSLNNGEASIVSPGSANKLNNKKYIDYYLKYDNILIIVDMDEPGILAAQKLKATLYKNKKNYEVMYMEKDFNDLLVYGGKEAVKEAYKKGMEMLRAGMHGNTK